MDGAGSGYVSPGERRGRGPVRPARPALIVPDRDGAVAGRSAASQMGAPGALLRTAPNFPSSSGQGRWWKVPNAGWPTEGQIGRHPADRRQALAGADPGVPTRGIGACIAGNPCIVKNNDRQIRDLPARACHWVISNGRNADRASARSRSICLSPPPAALCQAADLLAVVEQ